MMKTSTRLAPPHSLVLIEDSNGGEIPDSMSQSLIATTDSCIAVGCRAEDDGETEIVLGDCKNMNISSEQPMFDGFLQTPSRKLAVRTVLGATLLEISVLESNTRLMIWANDPTEPDHIAIGIV
jgi:hypothetical protein